MLLTGQQLKNTGSFNVYAVQSVDRGKNEVHMRNTESDRVIPMVMSRVEKGLRTGEFEEVKPKR